MRKRIEKLKRHYAKRQDVGGGDECAIEDADTTRERESSLDEGEFRRSNGKEVDTANDDVEPDKKNSILGDDSRAAAGGGAMELGAIPHAGKAFEESGGVEISTSEDGVAIEIYDDGEDDDGGFGGGGSHRGGSSDDRRKRGGGAAGSLGDGALAGAAAAAAGSHEEGGARRPPIAGASTADAGSDGGGAQGRRRDRIVER